MRAREQHGTKAAWFGQAGGDAKARRGGTGPTHEDRVDSGPSGAARVSRLFRRREVWLPTLWGWLLLLSLGALLVLALGYSALSLLGPQAPARGPGGEGAEVLVVEGWLDERELDHALDLIRRGRYRQVWTSGGPIDPQIDVGGWRNFALRTANYLESHGAGGVPVRAAPAPDTYRDRTYLSALAVRDRLRQSGGLPPAIDIYSAGPHGRRSRLLYRLAFGPDVEVGVLSAPITDFGQRRWWSSSVGVKTVIGEAIALGWTECCFWPGPEDAAAR